MTTETKPQIYAALIKAQQAMGPVKKEARGNYGKYATLDTVIDAIDQPLHDNDLTYVQLIRTEAEKSVLVTQLIYAPTGEAIESVYPILCIEDKNPQKFGGSITYARRYSLMALLGLAPEDDDGNSASTPSTRPASATTPAPRPAQVPARQVNTQTGEIASGDVQCEYRDCTRTCAAQWVEGSRRKYGMALCAIHGAQARDGEIDTHPKEASAYTRSTAEEVRQSFPGAEDVDPDEVASMMAQEGR